MDARKLGPLLLLSVTGTLAHGQTLSFLPPRATGVDSTSHYEFMCRGCILGADFNHDGKIDILYVIDNGFEFRFGVALGNGDGTFRAPTVQYGLTGRPFIGDFNGDGNLDVVIPGYYVGLFLGDGSGNFGKQIDVPACPSISVAADLNHDKRDDLVCGNSVLLSNGDGTFHAAPKSLDGQALLSGDFNGDGKPDLLISNNRQLAIALGIGDGTFQPALPIAAPSNLATILAADFNGDGHLDLVGSMADESQIGMLPGHGDGTFGALVATPWLPGPLDAFGDFNRDGKLDLVAGDAVLAGNGDGTFRFPVFLGVVVENCGFPQQVLVPCNYARSGAVVADFNGDGLPDIAAGYIAYGIANFRLARVSVLQNDSPGDGWTATGLSIATGTYPAAPLSPVMAFGTDLAPRTEAASSNPPPDTLGGIRVHVRDRSNTGDRLAPLLYVSPTQINYVLPSTDPYAWVDIERIGTPYVPKGMAVPIGSGPYYLAPELYTVGNGYAAASAVRIAPDGTRTAVPVTSCDAAGCTLVPIDVSGDPVYLSVYGTGFAHSTPATFSCRIYDTFVPLLYAGPQTQIAGLDQINFQIPKSLDRPEPWVPTVSCAFSSFNTNPVYVAIQ